MLRNLECCWLFTRLRLDYFCYKWRERDNSKCTGWIHFKIGTHICNDLVSRAESLFKAMGQRWVRKENFSGSRSQIGFSIANMPGYRYGGYLLPWATANPSYYLKKDTTKTYRDIILIVYVHWGWYRDVKNISHCQCIEVIDIINADSM